MSQKTITKINKRLEELKDALAGRLKDVLKDQNLSQSELARRADLRIPYVNRILQRKANATLESIARLEVALGMALIEMPETFEWLNSRRKPGDVEMKIRTSGTEASAVMQQPSNLEQR